MVPKLAGFESISKLNLNVCRCTKCDLSVSRTQAVPGTGDKTADIMLVGEAPGASEDRYGMPFVGRAGKVLDAALSAAGLPRNSVYITNVVKCRPPRNRKPNRQEMESCKCYLESEISLVCPRVIGLLGNTAYQSMLGGKSITKDRGKFFEDKTKWEQIIFFVTYHPAATIYNRDLEQQFTEDIAKMVRKGLTKNDC